MLDQINDPIFKLAQVFTYATENWLLCHMVDIVTECEGWTTEMDDELFLGSIWNIRRSNDKFDGDLYVPLDNERWAWFYINVGED